MEEHCLKMICERRLRRYRKQRVNRSELNTKHMFLGIFADVFEGISIVLFFSKRMGGSKIKLPDKIQLLF